MFRSGQRGEGKLGCILWTVALIIAALAAWKMIPVKIHSSQLYDYMLEQAKFGYDAPPKVIEDRIVKKAASLDLPLSKKQVKVERTRSRIRIRASYTVPVEFPGYTYRWHFNHDIDRDIFYF